MRRGNEPHFVFHNDQLIGVNLSADYCAEHEWGINTLRRIFKMNPTAPGLLKGAMEDAEHLFEVEFEYKVHEKRGREQKVLYVGFVADTMPDCFKERAHPPHDLHPLYFGDERDNLCAAWSDRDLGVLAKKGTEGEKHLKEIYTACKAGDGMICFGSQMVDNPFERAGLCVMIRSRLPEEWQKAAVEREEEEARLKQAWADAGGFEVMEQLQKAGKDWYALGEKIAVINRGGTDPEPVMCSWLNPRQQDIYDFGWVTVDDLRDWLNGTGRIMKKRKR